MQRIPLGELVQGLADRVHARAFPHVVIPLPRQLAAPLFPRLTAKLIRVTHAWLPGACAPVNNDDCHDPALVTTKHDDEIIVVVAATAATARPPPASTDAAQRPASTNRVPPWLAQACIVFLGMALCAYVGSLNSANATTWIGTPLALSCGQTFWDGDVYTPSLSCGIDGVACRPFSASVWFAVLCPPGCASDASQYASKHVVGGPVNYTADSNVCAAAVHAGVLDDDDGGCFELRFAGEQARFASSLAHGVRSTAFGWFPRSLTFRSTQGAVHCASTTWGYDAVVMLLVFALVVLWRCPPAVFFYVAVQAGFYYVALSLDPGTAFWIKVNAVQEQQLTLIPISMVLLRLFFPAIDPRAAPLDAYLLQFLPFWGIVHLNSITALGIDWSVSGEAQQLNTVSLAVLIVIAIFLIPAVCLQTRALYRAGVLPRMLAWFSPFAAYLVAVYLGGAPSLDFHLHHYAIGLFLVGFFPGHAWWRLPSLLQFVGVAFFVQGLVQFGTSPLFDTTASSSGTGSTGALYVPTDAPLWTVASNLGNGDVALEWRLPQDLAANWTCNASVTAMYPTVQNYLATNGRARLRARRSLLPADPGVNDFASSDYSYALGANGIVLAEGFGNQWIGSLPVANRTLVFQVALMLAFSGDTGVFSYELPLAFPVPSNRSAHFGYYNDGDDLCARLAGFYLTQPADVLAPDDAWVTDPYASR